MKFEAIGLFRGRGFFGVWTASAEILSKSWRIWNALVGALHCDITGAASHELEFQSSLISQYTKNKLKAEQW